jgi:hypothetical protein
LLLVDAVAGDEGDNFHLTLASSHYHRSHQSSPAPTPSVKAAAAVPCPILPSSFHSCCHAEAGARKRILQDTDNFVTV